jgi:uncharacterized membrane protein
MDLLTNEFLTDLLYVAALAVMVIAAWTALRIMFKLTVTLFRIGCFLIALVIGVALLAIILT